MTHWKKAFLSEYLSSSDIDGKDLSLTITHVTYNECVTQSGKKFCNVAHFKEQNTKPMILNVTNSKVVKKFAGNKTQLEEWKNIDVVIYVDDNVRFGSDTVEGLRLRPTQAKKRKELTTLTDDKLDAAIKFLKDGRTIADLKKHYLINSSIEMKLNDAIDAQS